MTRPDQSADDLRWQAFRYVADELADDDRIAFEARLADDPDACSAVAEAVALLGACLSLAPPTAVRRRRLGRWAGTAVALAAAATIVVALLPSGGNRPGLGDGSEADPGTTIAIERAWSRLQRSGPIEDAIEDVIEAEPDDWQVEFPADPADFDSEDSEGPSPPSWLLAAVELDDSDSTPPEH